MCTGEAYFQAPGYASKSISMFRAGEKLEPLLALPRGPIAPSPVFGIIVAFWITLVNKFNINV
jgi:hypothetical protein